MNADIIVALIGGIVTVVTVIIANISGNKAVSAKLDKQQAITETKLDALREEVKRHNDFARRVPVLEERLNAVVHRMDEKERS